ncbi:hypothetical protein SI65_03652 [Aspergillus cristatus]|uniref:Uncharacterized protein n=1 Tax=Aspergillus cristatus TaxID=573508 RepID=A0A1E3BI24_ASPCR|nr:hypothetical protein SI65_03652 [Aspergillus cristatus]
MQDLQECRANLRASYTESVHKLRNDLSKLNRSPIPAPFLSEHNISITEFNPYDKTLLKSNQFFFDPISLENYERFRPILRMVCYLEHNHRRKYQASRRRALNDPYERASMLYSYFREEIVCIPRKSLETEDRVLAGVAFWDSLKRRERCWSTVEKLHFFTENDKRDCAIYQPHIGLITLHDDNDKYGSLLLGELAAVAQALHDRLSRNRFKRTSLIPVLMISLFGPQHGRILQAHYGESGTFNVQMTRCFDFTTKNDDNIDLSLSFIISGPHLGKQALSYRTGRM